MGAVCNCRESKEEAEAVRASVPSNRDLSIKEVSDLSKIQPENRSKINSGSPTPRSRKSKANKSNTDNNLASTQKKQGNGTNGTTKSQKVGPSKEKLSKPINNNVDTAAEGDKDQPKKARNEEETTTGKMNRESNYSDGAIKKSLLEELYFTKFMTNAIVQIETKAEMPDYFKIPSELYLNPFYYVPIKKCYIRANEVFGEFIYPEEKKVYRGQIKNDIFHGSGVLVWNERFVYMGDFVEGFQDGVGILYDVVQKEQFNGKFSYGKRHGEGLLVDMQTRQQYNVIFDNETEILRDRLY